MDDQEPPFFPDFPSETENPQPKSHNFSSDKSYSFHNNQNHSHATKMENFKALFLRYAISSSPTKSLSPMQRSIIEQRLHDFFPDFHTPDHPPYAAMIETAIEKLNETGGSTEEAISQFIKNEYPDLPRAHDSLLQHHLINLWEDGAIVKAGNRFYVVSDVHMPDSLIVTHSPISSPTSHIDAESSPSLSLCSSPSWCSSASYSNFPSPKRKRPYAQRQKRGRKRGRQCKRTTKGKRIHLKHRGKRVKRHGRPRRKNVVEEEDQTDSDKLILEEEVEASEEQNGTKEEHTGVVEDHGQVRRKRRKIKEFSQRQETRTLIDSGPDQFEGMIQEEWRGKESREKSVCDNKQAEVLKKQKQDQAQYIEGKEEEDWPLQNHTETTFTCELQQEAEVEVVGQEDLLKDELREVIAKKDCAVEEHQVVVEENFLKDTKFEVIGEQSLLEEHDTETVKGARKQQKKRVQPYKRTMRGRKAHKKCVPIPGSCRGGPYKKDLLVEESQPNAEKLEATKTQEMMLEEKTEVIMEQIEVNKEGAVGIGGKSQLNGNGQETFGCSQAEEIETETEIAKPALIAEENESEVQHNLVMEGESRLIGCIKRCDEQQEHENIIDQEFYQSGKDNNEVSKEQNTLHRQQNEEQNQPVEKNIESNTEQEVEMAEMHNQGPQIQQKIQLGGEHDDAEMMIASNATNLPTESSGPVYEEAEEKVSKKDIEWQKESPGEDENTKICGKHTHLSPEFPTSELSSKLKLKSVETSSPPLFLQLPGPMSEEEKEETSKKNTEHQGESYGQDRNTKISNKPEFSSAELCSKLKSEEVSCQQESLQQPPQAQEKPRCLWDRFLKTFSLYCTL